MADNSIWDNGLAMTKEFESFRSKPYLDTMGKPTIGYGFNIEAYPQFKGRKSITRTEADNVIQDIYGDAVNRAMDYADTKWSSLTPKQQMILIDMSYNLGNKLMDFKDMRYNLMKGDTEGVKREMKNSKWYGQVGRRSRHHIANWGE